MKWFAFMFCAQLAIGQTIALTPVAPAAPSTPTLIYPDDASTTTSIIPMLRWSAVGGGVVTYNVQIDDNSDFSSPTVDATGIPWAFGALWTLSANTEYFWRVASHNGGGTSSWTSSRSFTTPNVVVRIGDWATMGTPGTSQTGSVSTTVPDGATVMVVTLAGYIGANMFSANVPKQNGEGFIVGSDGDGSASYYMGMTFYKMNPTSGNFTWDWGETPANTVVMQYAFYTGSSVDEAGTAEQGSGAGFTLGTVTANSGDMIVACAANNATGTATWTGTTEIRAVNSGGGFNSTSELEPTGNVTVSATISSSGGTDGAITGVVIHP